MNHALLQVTSVVPLGPYIFAADYGAVLRTTDLGQHWIGVNTDSSGRPITAGSTIIPVGGNTLLCGGLRSTDSGKKGSWELVSPGFNFDAMAVIRNNVFGSSGGYVWYSNDTGTHWKRANTGSAGPFAVIGSTLYARSGTISRSTDSGATWVSLGVPPGTAYTTAICTDGKALFSGTNIGLYVSLDGGASWKAVNEGLKDIYHGASQKYVGALGVFDTLLYINISQYANDGYWSTFHRPISEMVQKSGVKTVASVPALDSLEIFPNPASGLVTIRGSHSIVRVSVLNVLGGEVLNMPSVRASELTLDLSHFASGTYFLRIESAKGIVMRKVVRE